MPELSRFFEECHREGQMAQVQNGERLDSARVKWLLFTLDADIYGSLTREDGVITREDGGIPREDGGIPKEDGGIPKEVGLFPRGGRTLPWVVGLFPGWVQATLGVYWLPWCTPSYYTVLGTPPSPASRCTSPLHRVLTWVDPGTGITAWAQGTSHIPGQDHIPASRFFNPSRFLEGIKPGSPGSE